MGRANFLTPPSDQSARTIALEAIELFRCTMPTTTGMELESRLTKALVELNVPKNIVTQGWLERSYLGQDKSIGPYSFERAKVAKCLADFYHGAIQNEEGLRSGGSLNLTVAEWLKLLDRVEGIYIKAITRP